MEQDKKNGRSVLLFEKIFMYVRIRNETNFD